MWCKQCGQDVPGLTSREEGGFSCPRCGQTLHAEPAGIRTPEEQGVEAAEGANSHSAAATVALPPQWQDWEQDDRLEHIGRVLGSERDRRRRRRAAYRRERARLDPPHAAAPAWHTTARARPSRPSAPTATQAISTWSALIWLALSLGTMAFMCGGVLLGWSLWSGRQELWSIGLPVTLCGQIALLLGLLLQLDRLWHEGRSATAKLEVVDRQLHELKTTTTLLGTGQGTPGAFYAHFAQSASPQLLLTDLKSQLDLLAVKLSQNDEG